MLAVQPPAAPSPPAALSAALPAAESPEPTGSDSAARADSSATFNDGPRPGDKANPFRDQSLESLSPRRVANGSTTTVAHSVSSRLAKSQSVIESLQRNLVTKLSPTTIESLKSKYAATPAPLARPDPGLDLDLGPERLDPSPLLPAKSGAEVKQQAKKQANGKPAAVFDVSNVEGQSSVKLAFLSGVPVKATPRAVATTPKKAVERKPLHGPWARKVVDKPSNKPPVPTKKDLLVVVQKQEAVAKKKSPVRSPRKDARQDGLSELLKNLVTDTTRGSDSNSGTAADTTASTPRPPKPQPAPRTTSLPPTTLSPRTTDTPPPSGRRSSERAASPPSPSPRPSSLSPTRPSPATSPGRTPPERSQLLEERLNEIRKDLWEEEPDPAAPVPSPGRLRHDGVTAASPPPRSVQEATLEHYARAIQKHLDGQGGVPAAPRLSELHVDTSSSTHSSTSTLVSTPSQLSPGWASSEPRSPRGRRLTDSDASRATSPQKKRLRDELLGFYYRSLEREARRPPAPGRSGRLSAPPLPVVIPTDQATRTPDRTLRQQFIVVRDSDATYQNLQSLRRPPGSPLLASGEDSDSTTQDYSPRPRSNMNFFVRGGPQRNTIGSYPTRKTPPRDEVDLRREFGDVELRHPEKLAGLKKRHNSESEAAGKDSNAWVSPKDGKDAKKSAKANGGGKKSLFPIFRKGSLHPSQPVSPGTPPPTLPKRVSFSSATSPMYASTPNAHANGDGWPTRNGHAATPPTRVSRLDSSDSVFLPNSPSYYANGHVNGYAEQIYANQFTVAPGEGTYVNYTMPTPPELNGTARSASQQQPAPQGVYGNTPQPASGVYGSTKQTSNGVYGSTKLTSNGVYGSTKPTSNGVYGSTKQASSEVYGTALQSPTVVYGTRQQPVPSPSNQPSPAAGAYNPALPSPTSTYGSTQPSPSSEYGPAVFANTAFGNAVYGTRQQASPSPFAAQQRTPTSDAGLYGSASSPSTPYGTRPPNGASPGAAYSPSQPPTGPGFGPGSSPNTSAGSAPSPASTSLGTASSPYGQRQGGRIYGRTGLPPRAQSATPTMMAMAAAPDRPLPPIPRGPGGAPMTAPMTAAKLSQLTLSESESGSEAGEVQRILQQANDKRKISYFKFPEEEWGVGGKGRGPGDLAGPPGGSVRGDEEMRRGGGRGGRRDDPRRHTLGGDQHPHPPQGGALARSMDLEMSAKQRKKSPMARGYPPPSNAMLFDDDPGIMSEVETASTGFHRGGKQRSSLPVVRTPSKTLERPLGLVFLQYRSETKRALLPNEITSLDTVKALFVRSFCKQLTMEYLDSPLVKIYIHDSNKDMFYELEDHRSHLRDIRDRSVLRLFESTDLHSGVFPGAGTGLAPPPMWEADQSYFSEPEFDSEYQHQHIHKSKASKASGVPPQPYYMTHSFPPGGPGGPGPGSSATLPRGGSMMRAYSPAPKNIPPSALPMKSVLAPPAPLRSYIPPNSPVSPMASPMATPMVSPYPGPAPPARPPRPPHRKYFPPYFSPFSPSEAKGASGSLASPSPTPSQDRIHAESGYMSSPERGGPRAYPSPAYPSSAAVPYEEGYYGQYGTRSGSITPVIDEEASDTELMDEQYALYGVKLPGPGSGPRGPPAPARAPFPTPAGPPYDVTRIRVENMERQLANLTGLVQKALTHGPTHLAVPGSQGYRNASGEFDTHAPCSSASQDDSTFVRSDVKPPKLGKDKSVSFEKSVSFSDEPPDMNSPKQHSPQHGADTKPTKPAIKSSTLPRTSSQERDRHKPAPPPKPMSLSPGQYEGRNIYRDLQLTPEMYNQLRGLQKKAKDLRQEVRNLRRMSQAQAHSVRETIRDTFIKIRAMLITGSEGSWAAIGDAEKLRLSREEELYKQEMIRLEKDLTELESTVEELRGNVINRKTRVNMSDVENMALILSKSSKTVADLKVRFPGLQDEMKSLLSSEMDKVMREEKFLKEEPERLESALRRCKKLTGTLVTLKRLASVQEQRLPGPPGAVGADARLSPTLDDEPLPPTPNSASSKACIYGSARNIAAASDSGGESSSGKRPENALDALLDELQTFAKPPASNQTHPPTMAEIGRRKGSIEAANPPASNPTSSLRRLHSYPSSSDGGGNSPPNIARLQVSDSKPPVPERNADLLAKRVPPPPPPRTSSRSPLASPTSPSLPPRTQNPPSQPQMGTQGTLRRAQAGRGSGRSCSIPGADPLRNPLAPEEPTTVTPANAAASNSSSCESVDSQEGAVAKKERQEALEQRHQELLRKQRALQEQYARLQQLQRGTATVPTPDLLLKKTGSESNLLAKMGMQGLSAAAPMSGSLTHLASAAASTPFTTAQTTTSKIYETDIL